MESTWWVVMFLYLQHDVGICTGSEVCRISKKHSARRKEILRFINNTEYNSYISVSIAEKLTREINGIASYNEQTPEYVDEIREKLFLLHEYNTHVAKIAYTYPCSKEIYELLGRYVALESDVLYKNKYDFKYEKQIEDRVFRTIFTFLRNSFSTEDSCLREERNHLYNEALMVFVTYVDVKYTNDEEKFPARILRNILDNLGLIKKSSASSIGHLDLNNPSLIRLKESLKDSDYGSDDDGQETASVSSESSFRTMHTRRKNEVKKETSNNTSDSAPVSLTDTSESQVTLESTSNALAIESSESVSMIIESSHSSLPDSRWAEQQKSGLKSTCNSSSSQPVPNFPSSNEVFSSVQKDAILNFVDLNVDDDIECIRWSQRKLEFPQPQSERQYSSRSTGSNIPSDIAAKRIGDKKNIKYKIYETISILSSEDEEEDFEYTRTNFDGLVDKLREQRRKHVLLSNLDDTPHQNLSNDPNKTNNMDGNRCDSIASYDPESSSTLSKGLEISNNHTERDLSRSLDSVILKKSVRSKTTENFKNLEIVDITSSDEDQPVHTNHKSGVQTHIFPKNYEDGRTNKQSTLMGKIFCRSIDQLTNNRNCIVEESSLLNNSVLEKQVETSTQKNSLMAPSLDLCLEERLGPSTLPDDSNESNCRRNAIHNLSTDSNIEIITEEYNSINKVQSENNMVNKQRVVSNSVESSEKYIQPKNNTDTDQSKLMRFPEREAKQNEYTNNEGDEQKTSPDATISVSSTTTGKLKFEVVDRDNILDANENRRNSIKKSSQHEYKCIETEGTENMSKIGAYSLGNDGIIEIIDCDEYDELNINATCASLDTMPVKSEILTDESDMSKDGSSSPIRNRKISSTRDVTEAGENQPQSILFSTSISAKQDESTDATIMLENQQATSVSTAEVTPRNNEPGTQMLTTQEGEEGIEDVPHLQLVTPSSVLSSIDTRQADAILPEHYHATLSTNAENAEPVIEELHPTSSSLELLISENNKKNNVEIGDSKEGLLESEVIVDSFSTVEDQNIITNSNGNQHISPSNEMAIHTNDLVIKIVEIRKDTNCDETEMQTRSSSLPIENEGKNACSESLSFKNDTTLPTSANQEKVIDTNEDIERVEKIQKDTNGDDTEMQTRSSSLPTENKGENECIESLSLRNDTAILSSANQEKEINKNEMIGIVKTIHKDRNCDETELLTCSSSLPAENEVENTCIESLSLRNDTAILSSANQEKVIDTNEVIKIVEKIQKVTDCDDTELQTCSNSSPTETGGENTYSQSFSCRNDTTMPSSANQEKVVETSEGIKTEEKSHKDTDCEKAELQTCSNSLPTENGGENICTASFSSRNDTTIPSSANQEKVIDTSEGIKTVEKIHKDTDCEKTELQTGSNSLPTENGGENECIESLSLRNDTAILSSANQDKEINKNEMIGTVKTIHKDRNCDETELLTCSSSLPAENEVENTCIESLSLRNDTAILSSANQEKVIDTSEGIKKVEKIHKDTDCEKTELQICSNSLPTENGGENTCSESFSSQNDTAIPSSANQEKVIDTGEGIKKVEKMYKDTNCEKTELQTCSNSLPTENGGENTCSESLSSRNDIAIPSSENQEKVIDTNEGIKIVNKIHQDTNCEETELRTCSSLLPTENEVKNTCIESLSVRNDTEICNDTNYDETEMQICSSSSSENGEENTCIESFAVMEDTVPLSANQEKGIEIKKCQDGQINVDSKVLFHQKEHIGFITEVTFENEDVEILENLELQLSTADVSYSTEQEMSEFTECVKFSSCYTLEKDQVIEVLEKENELKDSLTEETIPPEHGASETIHSIELIEQTGSMKLFDERENTTCFPPTLISCEEIEILDCNQSTEPSSENIDHEEVLLDSNLDICSEQELVTLGMECNDLNIPLASGQETVIDSRKDENNTSLVESPDISTLDGENQSTKVLEVKEENVKSKGTPITGNLASDVVIETPSFDVQNKSDIESVEIPSVEMVESIGNLQIESKVEYINNLPNEIEIKLPLRCTSTSEETELLSPSIDESKKGNTIYNSSKKSVLIVDVDGGKEEENKEQSELSNRFHKIWISNIKEEDSGKDICEIAPLIEHNDCIKNNASQEKLLHDDECSTSYVIDEGRVDGNVENVEEEIEVDFSSKNTNYTSEKNTTIAEDSVAEILLPNNFGESKIITLDMNRSKKLEEPNTKNLSLSPIDDAFEKKQSDFDSLAVINSATTIMNSNCSFQQNVIGETSSSGVNKSERDIPKTSKSRCSDSHNVVGNLGKVMLLMSNNEPRRPKRNISFTSPMKMSDSTSKFDSSPTTPNSTVLDIVTRPISPAFNDSTFPRCDTNTLYPPSTFYSSFIPTESRDDEVFYNIKECDSQKQQLDIDILASVASNQKPLKVDSRQKKSFSVAASSPKSKKSLKMTESQSSHSQMEESTGNSPQAESPLETNLHSDILPSSTPTHSKNKTKRPKSNSKSSKSDRSKDSNFALTKSSRKARVTNTNVEQKLPEKINKDEMKNSKKIGKRKSRTVNKDEKNAKVVKALEACSKVNQAVSSDEELIIDNSDSDDCLPLNIRMKKCDLLPVENNDTTRSSKIDSTQNLSSKSKASRGKGKMKEKKSNSKYKQAKNSTEKKLVVQSTKEKESDTKTCKSEMNEQKLVSVPDQTRRIVHFKKAILESISQDRDENKSKNSIISESDVIPKPIIANDDENIDQNDISSEVNCNKLHKEIPSPAVPVENSEHMESGEITSVKEQQIQSSAKINVEGMLTKDESLLKHLNLPDIEESHSKTNNSTDNNCLNIYISPFNDVSEDQIKNDETIETSIKDLGENTAIVPETTTSLLTLETLSFEPVTINDEESIKSDLISDEDSTINIAPSVRKHRKKELLDTQRCIMESENIIPEKHSETNKEESNEVQSPSINIEENTKLEEIPMSNEQTIKATELSENDELVQTKEKRGKHKKKMKNVSKPNKSNELKVSLMIPDINSVLKSKSELIKVDINSQRSLRSNSNAVDKSEDNTLSKSSSEDLRDKIEHTIEVDKKQKVCAVRSKNDILIVSTQKIEENISPESFSEDFVEKQKNISEKVTNVGLPLKILEKENTKKRNRKTKTLYDTKQDSSHVEYPLKISSASHKCKEKIITISNEENTNNDINEVLISERKMNVIKCQQIQKGVTERITANPYILLEKLSIHEGDNKEKYKEKPRRSKRKRSESEKSDKPIEMNKEIEPIIPKEFDLHKKNRGKETNLDKSENVSNTDYIDFKSTHRKTRSRKNKTIKEDKSITHSSVNSVISEELLEKVEISHEQEEEISQNQEKQLVSSKDRQEGKNESSDIDNEPKKELDSRNSSDDISNELNLEYTEKNTETSSNENEIEHLDEMPLESEQKNDVSENIIEVSKSKDDAGTAAVMEEKDIKYSLEVQIESEGTETVKELCQVCEEVEVVTNVEIVEFPCLETTTAEDSVRIENDDGNIVCEEVEIVSEPLELPENSYLPLEGASIKSDGSDEPNKQNISDEVEQESQESESCKISYSECLKINESNEVTVETNEVICVEIPSDSCMNTGQNTNIATENSESAVDTKDAQSPECQTTDEDLTVGDLIETKLQVSEEISPIDNNEKSINDSKVMLDTDEKLHISKETELQNTHQQTNDKTNEFLENQENEKPVLKAVKEDLACSENSKIDESLKIDQSFDEQAPPDELSSDVGAVSSDQKKIDVQQIEIQKKPELGVVITTDLISPKNKRKHSEEQEDIEEFITPKKCHIQIIHNEIIRPPLLEVFRNEEKLYRVGQFDEMEQLEQDGLCEKHVLNEQQSTEANQDISLGSSDKLQQRQESFKHNPCEEVECHQTILNDEYSQPSMENIQTTECEITESEEIVIYSQDSSGDTQVKGVTLGDNDIPTTMDEIVKIEPSEQLEKMETQILDTKDSNSTLNEEIFHPSDIEETCHTSVCAEYLEEREVGPEHALNLSINKYHTVSTIERSILSEEQPSNLPPSTVQGCHDKPEAQVHNPSKNELSFSIERMLQSSSKNIPKEESDISQKVSVVESSKNDDFDQLNIKNIAQEQANEVPAYTFKHPRMLHNNKVDLKKNKNIVSGNEETKKVNKKDKPSTSQDHCKVIVERVYSMDELAQGAPIRPVFNCYSAPILPISTELIPYRYGVYGTVIPTAERITSNTNFNPEVSEVNVSHPATEVPPNRGPISEVKTRSLYEEKNYNFPNETTGHNRSENDIEIVQVEGHNYNECKSSEFGSNKNDDKNKICSDEIYDQEERDIDESIMKEVQQIQNRSDSSQSSEIMRDEVEFFDNINDKQTLQSTTNFGKSGSTTNNDIEMTTDEPNGNIKNTTKSTECIISLKSKVIEPESNLTDPLLHLNRHLGVENIESSTSTNVLDEGNYNKQPCLKLMKDLNQSEPPEKLDLIGEASGQQFIRNNLNQLERMPMKLTDIASATIAAYGMKSLDIASTDKLKIMNDEHSKCTNDSISESNEIGSTKGNFSQSDVSSMFDSNIGQSDLSDSFVNKVISQSSSSEGMESLLTSIAQNISSLQGSFSLFSNSDNNLQFPQPSPVQNEGIIQVNFQEKTGTPIRRPEAFINNRLNLPQSTPLRTQENPQADDSIFNMSDNFFDIDFNAVNQNSAGSSYSNSYTAMTSENLQMIFDNPTEFLHLLSNFNDVGCEVTVDNSTVEDIAAKPNDYIVSELIQEQLIDSIPPYIAEEEFDSNAPTDPMVGGQKELVPDPKQDSNLDEAPFPESALSFDEDMMHCYALFLHCDVNSTGQSCTTDELNGSEKQTVHDISDKTQISDNALMSQENIKNVDNSTTLDIEKTLASLPPQNSATLPEISTDDPEMHVTENLSKPNTTSKSKQVENTDLNNQEASKKCNTSSRNVSPNTSTDSNTSTNKTAGRNQVKVQKIPASKYAPPKKPRNSDTYQSKKPQEKAKVKQSKSFVDEDNSEKLSLNIESSHFLDMPQLLSPTECNLSKKKTVATSNMNEPKTNKSKIPEATESSEKSSEVDGTQQMQYNMYDRMKAMKRNAARERNYYQFYDDDSSSSNNNKKRKLSKIEPKKPSGHSSSPNIKEKPSERRDAFPEHESQSKIPKVTDSSVKPIGKVESYKLESKDTVSSKPKNPYETRDLDSRFDKLKNSGPPVPSKPSSTKNINNRYTRTDRILRSAQEPEVFHHQVPSTSSQHSYGDRVKREEYRRYPESNRKAEDLEYRRKHKGQERPRSSHSRSSAYGSTSNDYRREPHRWPGQSESRRNDGWHGRETHKSQPTSEERRRSEVHYPREYYQKCDRWLNRDCPSEHPFSRPSSSAPQQKSDPPPAEDWFTKLDEVWPLERNVY